MADRLYCALNGTTLRDLDARIHLLDVEELAPAVRTVTGSPMNAAEIRSTISGVIVTITDASTGEVLPSP